jgi:hypothetical protein
MSMKLSSSGSLMCLRATSPVLVARKLARVRQATGCFTNSAGTKSFSKDAAGAVIQPIELENAQQRWTIDVLESFSINFASMDSVVESSPTACAAISLQAWQVACCSHGKAMPDLSPLHAFKHTGIKILLHKQVLTR